jgi:predicted nicotinamide N-methyase
MAASELPPSSVSAYDDGDVLSDVHLLHQPTSYDTATCFAFALQQGSDGGSDVDDSVKAEQSWPPASRPAPSATCHQTLDADGDFVVRRRKRLRRRTEVLIRHECETPLAGVGMQVWRGALLLADCVVHRSTALRGSTVLELGCGCGLTGLVAASFASHVVLTDAPVRVLHNARHNVALNRALPRGKVDVRRLDWFDHLDPLTDGLDRIRGVAAGGGDYDDGAGAGGGGDGVGAGRIDDAGGESIGTSPLIGDGAGDMTQPDWGANLALDEGDRYGWDGRGGGEYLFAAHDLLAVAQTTLVLAADVIYDCAATEALVTLLSALLPRLPARAEALVSLERRVNFHLASLRPKAMAAEHFVALLRASKALKAEKMDLTEVPVCFEYERVPELEVWRVVAVQ